MAVTDPRDVAAAAPVSVSVAEGNAGSARVSDVRVTNVDGMAELSGALKDFSIPMTFSEAGGVFTLGTVAPYSFVGDATYQPATEGGGKVFTLRDNTLGFAFEFKLSGTPAVTDSITFADNAGGIADNRNAALLGALQTEKLMFGAGTTGTPTATLNNAYAQMVAKIGSKTREVQAGERTQGSLLAQATAARDSVSGVNLDEEAANLVRFQQTYQAAGRVMSVAQRLFDEMLAIGR